MPADLPSSVDLIRMRPGMYIGDPEDGSGLHHMLWEIVANSVDDHLAGHCRHVEIVIHPDDSLSVRDDGCGIPIDLDEGGRRFAEHVVTRIHHTPNRDGHTPHSHVGSMGAGLCVVNALSEAFELEIQRDGSRWAQRYARGVAVTDLARQGPADGSGTYIRFRPDPGVFSSIEVDYDQIRARLHVLASLSNGLVFDLRDERRRRATLSGGGGLGGLLRDGYGHRRRRPLESEIRIAETVGDTRVNAILGWDDAPSTEVVSFVNMQRTRGGGSHVEGLMKGLAMALQAAALPGRIPRGDARRAIERGLRAAIHVVVHHDVRFVSPVKDTLAAPDIEDLVRDLVAREVEAQLGRLPDLLRTLLSGAPSPSPATGATPRKRSNAPGRRRRRTS